MSAPTLAAARAAAGAGGGSVRGDVPRVGPGVAAALVVCAPAKGRGGGEFGLKASGGGERSGDAPAARTAPSR